jgi:hypothetical protein
MGAAETWRRRNWQPGCSHQIELIADANSVCWFNIRFFARRKALA